MFNKFCTNIFFCAALLLVGCNDASSQQQKMPDFTFTRLDEHPFKKSDIDSSKNSVLILFDTSCSHCQAEIADIGKKYNSFKNVNFYLITLDEKKEIDIFMNKYGKVLKNKPNVTLLKDSFREFIPKFNPTKYPSVYVYSTNLTLIEYFGGETDVKKIVAAANK